jgi:hypothetical protein
MRLHRAATAAATTTVGTATGHDDTLTSRGQLRLPSPARLPVDNGRRRDRPARDQLRQPNGLALPAASTARVPFPTAITQQVLNMQGDARQATRHDSRSPLTGWTRSAGPDSFIRRVCPT